MMSGAGCVWLGRSEPDCEDEMAAERMYEPEWCPLVGCTLRNWHRGKCANRRDAVPAKRISCCQHASFSSATVNEVAFCVCRDCGHRWQSWELVVNWL